MTPMHCPNCRHDNPATTRFCHSCGAVLVEDAPGLGRRRVLRPWGLRRAAPPTISPEMPEIPRRNPPRVDALARLDLVLAGGVVVAVVAATLWFPRSMASDATPAASTPPGPSEAVTIVVTTPLQATSVTSPALVEPTQAPTPSPAREPPRPPRAAAPRLAPAPIVPVAAPPSAETPAVEAPPAPPAPPPLPPPVRTDRWDPLREALAACRLQGNIFERAMCEQGARIRHCTEHWDLIELCPSGRPAITQ
jgi:hypothetical protein